MPSRTSASAGLAAIAVTAGTLFMTSPASAQTTTAATHVSTVAAHVSAGAPYDDGWRWHHRHFRHRHFRHHHFRHHHFRDFDDFGFRHRHFHHFGGFAGNVNRNVNVVSDNIGISNSNTNVAIAHDW